MPRLKLNHVLLTKVDTLLANNVLYKREAFIQYIDEYLSGKDMPHILITCASSLSKTVDLSTMIGLVDSLYIEGNDVYCDLIIYSLKYYDLIVDNDGVYFKCNLLYHDWQLSDGIEVINGMKRLISINLTADNPFKAKTV